MEKELSALNQLGLLRSPSLDTITQHIDPAWIEQALQQTGTVSIRHRRLPAQQVVWLILGMALFADRSIASVMSHLRLYGKNPGTPMEQPPTPGAIVQARDRLGEAPLQQLFQITADRWAQQGHTDQRLHGLRTLAMDGSHLVVPDSFDNAEAFGIPRSGRSLGAFPQLRIVTMLDTHSHIALRAQLGPWTVGEPTLAKPLVEQMPPDSVLLVDMGLCGYEILARISAQGGRRFWMTRKKRNVRYRVVKTLGPGDQLVVLSRPKGLSPKLPSQLVARALRYHWPGYSPQTLLTSLLSAEHFPAAELIAHYHERWEAELSLDEVKTHLLVGQGTQLRSRSPERVRQEAWGLLVMYNLVRLQMLRLAHQHGVPARRLSFRGAALLIGSVWASAWLTPPGTIYGLMSEMERNLKQLLLPARRSRSNPREVKRKMSNYPKKQRRHHLI